MKTTPFYLTLLALVLLISSCSKKELDENSDSNYAIILDAKFEQKLIDLGIDSDETINKKILKSDAASIEKLILNNEDIQSLTGIEAFKNLKRLYAGSNDLTTLDLSKNTMLDTLYLAGNKLNTVDLSFNKNLVYVELISNDLNHITGLINATGLKYLNLSFNYLTEFTIENPSLVTLNIENNDIENFDAYLATNLEKLIMYTNKVKTLDFTNNLKLKILRIADNKLTHLTLGQKDDLFYFSCSNNFLTTLDVSHLNSLTRLYISDNPNLTCVKIKSGQQIPTVGNSTYQDLKTNCN
jgi:hypothetical protein